MVSRLGLFSQISEIKDYLYLSGATPVRADVVRSKKITCIVNATIDEPCLYLPGIDYLKVRVDDSPFVHIDAYFDMVAERVRNTRDAGGKILLHCVAGVSRSATLTIASLMKLERLTLRDAYYRVKAIRPIIRPNNGFWRQLIEYERRLFGGKNTVRMVLPRKGTEEVPDVYGAEIQALNGFSSLSLMSSSTSSPRSLSNTRRAMVERVTRKPISSSLTAPMVRSTSLFSPLSSYLHQKPEYSSLHSGLWK